MKTCLRPAWLMSVLLIPMGLMSARQIQHIFITTTGQGNADITDIDNKIIEHCLCSGVSQTPCWEKGGGAPHVKQFVSWPLAVFIACLLLLPLVRQHRKSLRNRMKINSTRQEICSNRQEINKKSIRYHEKSQ